MGPRGRSSPRPPPPQPQARRLRYPPLPDAAAVPSGGLSLAPATQSPGVSEVLSAGVAGPFHPLSGEPGMRVFLVNPSHVSFGTAVITPRWLYVLAAATPARFGDPVICAETLEVFDPQQVRAGDIVGIGIHTGNALRGYEVGRAARERGAWVVYGGIHATLYPQEALDIGGAHAVVKGDGDVAWARVLEDCLDGRPEPVYEAGRVP